MSPSVGGLQGQNSTMFASVASPATGVLSSVTPMTPADPDIIPKLQ